jgi:hypothetical protein
VGLLQFPPLVLVQLTLAAWRGRTLAVKNATSSPRLDRIDFWFIKKWLPALLHNANRNNPPAFDGTGKQQRRLKKLGIVDLSTGLFGIQIPDIQKNPTFLYSTTYNNRRRPTPCRSVRGRARLK